MENDKLVDIIDDENIKVKVKKIGNYIKIKK